MNAKSRRIGNYRLMLILALVVGIVSIVLQFLPDFGILAFMLSLAALGGLIGGESSYEERERQQLRQSYKLAFEWMLLVIMAFYAVIELSGPLPITAGIADFLNGRWPGLLLAVMCILMAIVGFRRKGSETSA